MPDPSAAAAEPKLTSDTIRILENRVSVRKYADKPLDDATVDTVLKAAFRAPTSSNIQAYSVVVVRDPEIKARLSEVAGNQKHIRETPVFLAFCADLTRIEAAARRHGRELGETNLEMGLVSTVDAALVGMSAYLAADSVGLKGVMIGAVRNDATRTAAILGLPSRVYCVFGMCLGWPGEAPPQKPRMDPDAIVHTERYGEHAGGLDPDRALDGYDAALAAHYEGIGKPTTADSWTHEIAAKFDPQPRQGLRRQLEERGFDFG